MRSLKFIALTIFVAVLALGGLFVANLGSRSPDSKVSQDFVVVAGESTVQIANHLENQGLIKNSFSFFVYIKLVGAKLLPGVYEVSAAQSASSIGWSMGSGHFKTERLTVIEGWRVSQIADYLNEKKLAKTTDFLAKAQQYEGYLFPDTYEVRTDITSDELIEIMRSNFKTKTADLHVTPETIILASIVEREAQAENDRAPVAGVYSNRVKIGMKLDADPTVQYAKGSWKAITRDDYRSTISPYNTYLNAGLPPGPICSPGLASIKAASTPAEHDFFYFFHAKGETYFSKTLAEHTSKVARYF